MKNVRRLWLWLLAGCLMTGIVASLGPAQSTPAAPAPSAPAAAPAADPHVQALAREVHDKGWIIYGAMTPGGDWDLFVMRPDGTDVRNLTNTPDWSELEPRFSPDGSQILYRRTKKGVTFDNNRHGAQGELWMARSDGSGAAAFGKDGEYPWASWSPDGREIVCLDQSGIFFVDVATRKTVRRIDRKGFFQQMTWSPDGKWLVGVANSLDTA